VVRDLKSARFESLPGNFETMVISKEQARTILEAFDKLQMEDLLSHDQWLCAIAIMDYYLRLGQEYFYLRDRYSEKLCEQEPLDPSSMGSGLH
jgi:hypothetical protein